MIRRFHGGLGPQRGEALFDLGRRDGAADLGIELRDDVRGQSRRSEHAVPGRDLESRQRRFAYRGHFRQQRGTRSARHGNRSQLAGLNVRHRHRQAHGCELYLPGEQIPDELSRSLVGNVHHPHARHRLEQLEREMIWRAVAGRPETQLSGPGSRQRNQLLH